jgi:hypothetical protein
MYWATLRKLYATPDGPRISKSPLSNVLKETVYPQSKAFSERKSL